MDSLTQLREKNLWKYFLEVSSIPRESGNEEGIRNYLVEFAKEHNLEHYVDKTGNVIIKAKATKGFETVPSIALQGHMDMVCVKDEGIIHDFTKDPIPVYRDGDFLRGRGTTLGGDNGVAIAMVLDLFSDKEAQHGPLEAIITVEEETGLAGAFGLNASLINSRLMINLDSEEEGIFYIGCAGGIEVNANLPVNFGPLAEESVTLEVTVDGLQGGHSGAEIDKQRGNAITIMARYLLLLEELQLISMGGGTKRNVIPSYCQAKIAIPSQALNRANTLREKVLKELKGEFVKGDPGVNITLKEIDGKRLKGAPVKESNLFLKSLFIAPHGVERMSEAIEGLVETSSNLAIVKTTAEGFSVISSHRSSVQSARDNVARKMVVALETSGAKATLEGSYPAWTPNPASPLAASVGKAWEKFSSAKPTVTAIHAGLECGIINSLVDGMDSLSMGPSLFDVHSTKERLSISSTERMASFLRHLLVSL